MRKRPTQADGDRTATAQPVPANLSAANTANTARFPGRVSFTDQKLRTWVSELQPVVLGRWTGAMGSSGGFYLDEESPVSVLRDNRNTVTFCMQSNSSIVTKLSNRSASVFEQLDYRFAPSWSGGRRGCAIRKTPSATHVLRFHGRRRRAASLHVRPRFERSDGSVSRPTSTLRADDVMLYRRHLFEEATRPACIEISIRARRITRPETNKRWASSA